MNIDFHTHVKLAKKTRFDLNYFMEMVREAKASGLTAIAVTEHFNTMVFEEIYETLDREFPYRDGFYEVEGLRLFPGMEVDIWETGHILLIGDRKDVVELRGRLNGYTKEGEFVPFRKLLDWSEEYTMLRIGAHPFRDSTPLHHVEPELLRRLDAFDMNGKDLYSQGTEAYRKLIYSFAAGLGKPVVGGSDTHQYLQYGCIYNRLDMECGSVRELKEAIEGGKYHIHVSPCLGEKVKSATAMKKLLKQQWKLEESGDRNQAV